MVNNEIISNIKYNDDFKSFYMNRFGKVMMRLEKKPSLIEDIYDFDITDLEYKFEEGEEIKNFLRYKIIYELIGFDCDNIAITKEILKLFLEKQGISVEVINPKDNGNRIFVVNNNVEIETDTMNSFWTIFKEFTLKYICSDLKNKYEQCYGKSTPMIRDYWLLKNFDSLFSKEILADLELKYKGILDCYNEFRRFAILTHSIGNFTLVPRKYNVGRYSLTKDCWDLSLIDLQNKQEVYKWYNANIHVFLYDSCFKAYNKNTSFNNQEVELLYDNHSFKSKLPTEINEYHKYINNVNNRIISRGKEIIRIINE